jgi:glycosyltransferase involved in cell wall biosynthesis
LIGKKIKILLFIPNLSAGGAERVMLFIAKNLSKNKFDAKLVVIGSPKDTFYETKEVEIIYLNRSNVKKAIIPIFKLFKIFKPNIVLGSLTHVNYIIALVSIFFPKITCVARETFVISVGEKFNDWNKKPFHRINNLISKIAHKRIDYFICQSNDMKNDMMNNFKYKNKKIITINNPVSEDIKTKTSILKNDIIQFITVGRLVEQKGYERIINVLSTLDIAFNYTIIGNGKEEGKILSLAKKLNVLDKITHIPKTNKVYELLAKSHVYLMGSYLEGFPNALIESLAVGTPAIVYKAPGGINEIIKNDENGYLVKNDIEFRERILFIVENISSFNPKNVSNHVKSSFGARSIIEKYETLFFEINEQV